MDVDNITFPPAVTMQMFDANLILCEAFTPPPSELINAGKIFNILPSTLEIIDVESYSTTPMNRPFHQAEVGCVSITDVSLNLLEAFSSRATYFVDKMLSKIDFYEDYESVVSSAMQDIWLLSRYKDNSSCRIEDSSERFIQSFGRKMGVDVVSYTNRILVHIRGQPFFIS